MKTNFKISQFSRFLLRSEYAIQVKIWKWLKLLNSVPFIKKTLVNQVYTRIWSFWLTFTVLQWVKTNFKISQFSRFLLRTRMGCMSKLENDKNFLILFHSSRKHCKSSLNSNFIILTDIHSFTVRKTPKLVNFQVSSSGLGMRSRSKFDND